MAFAHKERCSCGSEIELATDGTKTNDPKPVDIGSMVKEWRTKHKHVDHSAKPPYTYPSTWNGPQPPYVVTGTGQAHP